MPRSLEVSLNYIKTLSILLVMAVLFGGNTNIGGEYKYFLLAPVVLALFCHLLYYSKIKLNNYSIYLILSLTLCFAIIQLEFMKILAWMTAIILCMCMQSAKIQNELIYYFVKYLNRFNVVFSLICIVLILDLYFFEGWLYNFMHTLNIIKSDIGVSFWNFPSGRIVGYVGQASLVPAFIILPSIIQLIFFDEGAKTKFSYIVNLIFCILSFGGSTVILYLLVPFIFISFKIFSIKIFKLIPFITQLVFGLGLYHFLRAPDFLWKYDQSFFQIRSLDDRFSSGVKRVYVILEQFKEIFLSTNIFTGVNVNDTAHFGNIIFTNAYRIGIIGYVLAFYVFVKLNNNILNLVKTSKTHSDILKISVFYSCVLQFFIYNDFGMSNYYGFVMILILNFLTEKMIKSHSKTNNNENLSL
jgi:hypothetical protein